MRQNRTLTFIREGNSIYEKIEIGDIEFKVPRHLNEEIEWKDKEENPFFHVKVNKYLYVCISGYATQI